jgi:orotidine-5'-phosphate decarboxylase
MSFRDRLREAQRRHGSLLCIGLDPDPQMLEGRHIPSFLQAVIEATCDIVCCYKVNLAFFEVLGPGGMNVLLEAIAPVPPSVPVIADAKRGDVPHVARLYARALLEVYGFDAITVNPYGGPDALEPFLEYQDKGVFVWCRGSNPGAAHLQALPTADGRPFFLVVADMVRALDRGNAGLVVGATAPDDIVAVRRLCPDMPLLVPGVGPQGGDLEAAVAAGLDREGGGLIVVAARRVLYADGRPLEPQAVRRRAQALRDEIERARQKASSTQGHAGGG